MFRAGRVTDFITTSQHVGQIGRETVPHASLISRLSDWFRRLQSNGTPVRTLSTPRDFSRWRVQRLDNFWRVVNDEHVVVADHCTMEAAGEIADAHNEADPIKNWNEWVLYRDHNAKTS